MNLSKTVNVLTCEYLIKMFANKIRNIYSAKFVYCANIKDLKYETAQRTHTQAVFCLFFFVSLLGDSDGSNKYAHVLYLQVKWSKQVITSSSAAAVAHISHTYRYPREASLDLINIYIDMVKRDFSISAHNTYIVRVYYVYFGIKISGWIIRNGHSVCIKILIPIIIIIIIIIIIMCVSVLIWISKNGETTWRQLAYFFLRVLYIRRVRHKLWRGNAEYKHFVYDMIPMADHRARLKSNDGIFSIWNEFDDNGQ